MTTNHSLEIKGNLLRHTPAEILLEAAHGRLSGSLRFSHQTEKAIVYIESGKVAYAVSNLREHRLFQILFDERVVSRETFAKIENVASDLLLAKALIEKNLFSKEDLAKFSELQVRRIVAWLLPRQTGEWIFSPLARVQPSLKLPVNLKTVFRNYAETIEKQKTLGRFKTLDEIFFTGRAFSASNFGEVNLSSEEAFVLSRLSPERQEIKEIQKICGLPTNELLFVLYKLWVSGLVFRRNWNSPFSEADLAKISAAKFSLKQSAAAVGENRTGGGEMAESVQLEAERKAREEKHKEKIELEKYLKQVENATSHYDLFGVDTDTDISAIKTVYFSIAKKFHPDIFHKKVDPVLHQRIQSAFTEIAEAYDTLKNPEAREIYNFKLRKALEALKEEESGTLDQPFEKSGFEGSFTLAAESFNAGYELLMADEFEEAIPHLARAVQLNSLNARYHAFYGKALAHNSKQYRKAAAELKEAVTLDPQKPIYRLMLAEIYEKVGLLTSARGELNRILEFDPNNSDARLMLGRLSLK